MLVLNYTVKISETESEMEDWVNNDITDSTTYDSPLNPLSSTYNKVFMGNVDNNTKQYSGLATPTEGRYVRIYPREYKGAPYMRAGVMVAL